MLNFKSTRSAMLAALAGAMLYREGEPGVDGSNAAPAVPPAPSDYVGMEPVTFHFKKEKLTDEKGNVVGEGKKLPKADLFLPVPKNSRIIEILQDTTEQFAKERKLIRDAILDVVYGAARSQINAFREVEANKDQPVTQATLDLDKLDWTFIANIPKGERGITVPSDEDIQAFLDKYLEVMPAATNKTKEKIENHVALFKAGFKKQRNQKELLEVFRQALAIFATNISDDELEDHMAVVEYFQNKLDRMLKAEEKITIDDI